MASLVTLKVGLAASLGLGVLDLAWIDLSIGPRALTPEPMIATRDLPDGPHDQPRGLAASRQSVVQPVPRQAEPPEPPPRPPEADVRATPPAPPGPVAARVEVASQQAEPGGDVATKPPEPDVDVARQPPKPDVVVSQPPAPAPELQPVFFETMSAQLGADARVALARLLKQVSPDDRFQLDGHTDYRGDEGYNQQLSEQRVASVQRYLQAHGIASSRISGAGLGERGASSTESSDLARDRRVDIHVIGGKR